MFNCNYNIELNLNYSNEKGVPQNRNLAVSGSPNGYEKNRQPYDKLTALVKSTRIIWRHTLDLI